MEPTQKTPPRHKIPKEEVDLGQLFYNTGGAISTFFSRLGRLINSLFMALLNFLLFLRRNLVWLLAGTLLGLGYGYYLTAANGPKFTAQMTVRANFASARSLYSSADYFNALINNSQVNDLARIFSITPQAASTLVYFEASPVRSETITAEMYSNQFLTERNSTLRRDTFWTRVINYKDYKASLTKFDYPIHQVTVTSTSSTVFPQIEQGLIKHVSNNKLLKEIEQSASSTNKEMIDLLAYSIRSLDTLRSAYNKRLVNQSNPGSAGSNVTVLDGGASVRAPELDLYDKLLQLKNELKATRDMAVLENDIIQVYAPFGSIGRRESIFQQHVFRYTLLGFLTALIIVSAIGLNSYLKRLDQRLNRRERNVHTTAPAGQD